MRKSFRHGVEADLSGALIPYAVSPTREVNGKQALEQLPVVGYAKVQKLVNDYVILENEGLLEQCLGKTDISCR